MSNLTINHVINVFLNNQRTLLNALLEHIWISYVSVLMGISLAVPIGIALTRRRWLGKKVLAVLGVLQTIPSMVMFGVLIPLFGIGKPTAMIVLTLYSILPILRNTFTGISEVPDNYVEAATGMGMTGMQVLFRIELPIALPVIVTGIRLASVYITGWATLAALVGGGGLGDVIFTGLARHNHAMLLLGTIPVCLLTITTSFIIGRIATMVTPAGLKR